MTANNRGFVHLVIIVLIALVGLGGFLYYSWQKGMIITSQQVPTSPNSSNFPKENPLRELSIEDARKTSPDTD